MKIKLRIPIDAKVTQRIDNRIDIGNEIDNKLYVYKKDILLLVYEPENKNWSWSIDDSGCLIIKLGR